MSSFVFLISLIGWISHCSSVLAVAPFHGTAMSPLQREFPEQLSSEIINSQISSRFRLPNQIVPRYYKLEIRPIINDGEEGQFTAPGTVQITVECLEATTNLVVHAADLNINQSAVKVWPSGNPTLFLTVQSSSFQPENETFTITVLEPLTSGDRYEISIEYIARIPDPTERMNGLYRSSYLTESGETRYLATTQFSRTQAFRKTLPSFDEPNQKAVFEISIGRQGNHHSLSNMDLRVSEPIAGKPDWVWDRYNPTPIMPPTVIAFIVSEFSAETAPPDLFHPNKPVKVWGPPPALKNGAAVYAAETGAKILKHFEEYFEIDYELPKMDLAAIPDFAAGAMENWGLNTYRVIYLVWTEGVNTVADKFRCSSILGHELAHQYWGNLVTHEWWNDWWLTEGFASYFEYTSVLNIQPEFQALNRLVTSDTQPAMEFDAGPLSVPIHGNVTSEFVENPSVINYSKGAALVSMMQAILSEQVFRQSVIYYLNKRRYTAVNQDALFTDLMEYLVDANSSSLPSNNKTIKEIMDSWTLQTGFPLVRVSYAGSSLIYVSQVRFENFKMRNGKQANGKLWNVPIAYVSGSDPSFDGPNLQPRFWIDDDVLSTSHAVDTNQWLVINPHGQSYYRVLYDEHFASLLTSQLAKNISSIAIGSRSMIVDDYFTCAYQRYINIEEALRMTRFIRNETDFNVFVPFLKHLRQGFLLFSSNETEFNALKKYVLNGTNVAFGTIGFEQKRGEDPLWTVTRSQLFDWVCPMESPGCVSEAQRLLAIWQSDPSVNPVPVDIRQSIYCTAATASITNWEFLLKEYDSSKDTIVRNSLACSSNVTALQSVLEKALTDSQVLTQDVVPLIQRVAMNSEGLDLVMTLLENRFTQVFDKVGAAGVAEVINTLSIYFRYEKELERITKVVATHGVELVSELNRIQTFLTRISENMLWMKDFGNFVLTWLQQENMLL